MPINTAILEVRVRWGDRLSARFPLRTKAAIATNNSRQIVQ
ncbi:MULTISPECIES: hypothetical protein [Nostoc]|nr:MULTISPECIES: hypothetical protein [Nostoc]